MKKILLIVILIAYSASYAQNTKLRGTIVKGKYENVFYKSPNKYNNQEQKFIVSNISFATAYKDSKSKHIYEISVTGKVNNKKEQIIYYAKSIDELEYYTNIFRGKYSKILLVEYDYKIASKNYHDALISVEF